MFLAKPPKQHRTPWRMGSSASKRVERRAAWMPTQSALQWSMAMNTAAWPLPVTVKLRYADFRTLTRSRTGAGPVASRSALAAAAVELVRGVPHAVSETPDCGLCGASRG